MAFLTLNGISVPCALQAQSQGTPRLIGERATAFSGRTRSTVRGHIRTWSLATPPIPLADARALELALASQYPLIAGGDLMGGVETPVIGQLDAIRHRKYADGERAVVEFTLQDAEPYRPILYWLRADRPLPAGMSFSRASGATLIDRTGTLQEVGPDVPRIDWSHGRPALRLEGSRTNGWTWSEDLSQSAWLKDGVAVITDAATAPNGQATMDKVVEDATTGVHQIRRALSGASDNTKQAISFWVAAAERTWVRISTNGKDSATVLNSYFNLATGEFGTVTGRHSLRVIERVGSAYRLECVFDVSSGAETPQFRVGPTTGDAMNTYTGDGTSGIYLWGLQFEADQPFASSYIKTTSTTVTRALDQIMVTPAPAPQPMTVYLRFRERGTAFVGSFSADLIGFSSPTSRPLWQIDGTNTPGRYRVIFGLPGGVNSMSMTPVSAAMDDDVEILATLSSDGAVRIHVSINGGPVQSGGVGPAIGLPGAWGVDRLTLGSSDAYTLLRDALVLRGADWTMDQIRRLVV